MTPDREKEIKKKILSSETLGALMQMSQAMPIDVHNKAEMKTALASTVFEVVYAIDEGRITFADDPAQAYLYGLLIANLEWLMDGRLSKQAIQEVEIH